MADLTSLNVCPTCSCFCWLVAADCVVSMSELTASNVIRVNDINNANDDTGDLLGELCFEQLCAALTQAVADANEYNEDDQNPDKKNALDFLSSAWAAVITNRHFKKWYSNRVAWHWFEGSSITQLKSVGLITASNEDEAFKNGFKHADEIQRKRLCEVAARLASDAKRRFQKYFWDLVKEDYACTPSCGCAEDEKTGESIGMSALDK